MPSLRVIVESKIPKSKWTKAQYEKLVMPNETTLWALHNVQTYQIQTSSAFNKKVKLRKIQESDLILKQKSALI